MIPFFGSRDGIPLDLEVDISRDEFVAACSHLLARARQCLESALTASKATPESIQRVLMVGGTTYIPAVREMVASVSTAPSPPMSHPIWRFPWGQPSWPI